MGDMNFAPDAPRENAALAPGLRDVWPALHPDEPGATVDSALVAPYLPTVLSLKDQVQSEYLPNYGGRHPLVKWSAGSTLFGIWIGINDVGNTYWMQNATLYDEICRRYPRLSGRFAVITGDTVSPGNAGFLQLAGIPYLAKPFEPRQVTELVARLGSEPAGYE